MHSFSILSVLLIFITKITLLDGHHSQPDEELPPISWKKCGLSARDCDPKTFKDPTVSPRIWGGEYARTGEYPYFVYLGVTYAKQIESMKGKENIFKLAEGNCGGAILNEWWILTAAHCIPIDITGAQNISIQLSFGSINRFVGRYLDVERVVMHSTYMKASDFQYRSKKLGDLIKLKQKRDENKTFITQMINEYNSIKKEQSDYLNKHMIPNCKEGCDDRLWDIALLKVKPRIVPVFNETHFKINSICLPKSGLTNTQNERVAIIGMGLSEPNGRPSNLKKGITILLKNSYISCKESYCTHRLSKEINPLLNSSQCRGDSGSPVFQYHSCRALQIGIIIRSNRNGGCATNYGWHLRVPNFMPWIRWVILSKDIMITSKTNILLILSVITTAIIAVIVSFALLWITVLVLRRR